MKLIDDISLNEAIILYYEKHHAIRIGDINKLREIKNKYPGIFENDKDIEIKKIIDDIKTYAESACYKMLRQAELKSKLSLIETAE